MYKEFDSRGRWRPNFTEFYKGWIDPIRDLGWQFGYCMAFHGSLRRDLDVFAVPWIEHAADDQTLAYAVRDLVKGTIHPPPYNPKLKPHGRISWVIHFPPIGDDYTYVHAYVDLSVMPRQSKD
jgi:hypothetical protein